MHIILVIHNHNLLQVAALRDPAAEGQVGGHGGGGSAEGHRRLDELQARGGPRAPKVVYTEIASCWDTLF